jgi:FAD/FMN-containing dehydrogenase
MLVVVHLGEAVRAVPADATAYAMRAPRFVVNVMANWHDAGEDETHVAWARYAWDRICPHSTRVAYLNFLGAEEHAQASLVRAAFGQNYDRLVHVKRRYDPDNLFRLNHNITPAP